MPCALLCLKTDTLTALGIPCLATMAHSDGVLHKCARGPRVPCATALVSPRWAAPRHSLARAVLSCGQRVRECGGRPARQPHIGSSLRALLPCRHKFMRATLPRSWAYGVHLFETLESPWGAALAALVIPWGVSGAQGVRQWHNTDPDGALHCAPVGSGSRALLRLPMAGYTAALVRRWCVPLLQS